MPARKWDSTLIVRTIKRYHRERRDLSYNAMARMHQGLVSAANYYYGTYRKAVMAAGIDYDSIRHKPCWNRKRIVEVLCRAQRDRQPLNWASVSNRRDKLGWAAKAAVRQRLYGNWDDALAAAGIDPAEVRRYHPWSPEQILRELRQRHRRKLATNSKAIQSELPGLYGAATRRFGSYEAALQQAGIDPADVTQRREWSREAVRERLREFEHSFGFVSQVMLRRYDSGLLRAVRVWYGTLPAAIKAARIEKYSVRGHRVTTSKRLPEPIGWREKRTRLATAQ